MESVKGEQNFNDNQQIFGPTNKNTIIYRLHVMQNTKVNKNKENIESRKSKLYKIYQVIFYN